MRAHCELWREESARHPGIWSDSYPCNTRILSGSCQEGPDLPARILSVDQATLGPTWLMMTFSLPLMMKYPP
jgi:hypothetical protein